MRSLAVTAGLFCLTLQLYGCSSTANSLPAGATIDASPGAKSPKGTVRFRINIPRGAASAALSHFVSPSTQSMTFSIKLRPGGVPIVKQTVNLTNGSPGCTQFAQSLSCVVDLELHAKKYFASLITFDGLNGAGNALSVGQYIRFRVRAAQITTVGLSVGGVPHALFASGVGDAVGGSQTAGFTLYGTTPQKFVLSAADADGNLIVGTGSPRFSLSVLAGNGWTVASTADPAMPNVFSVTPPGNSGSTVVVGITANGVGRTCAQPAAVCSGSFSITNRLQTLFVGGTCASGCTSKLLAYAAPYTGVPIVIGTYTGIVTAMTVDKSGNLFVGICNSTCLASKGSDEVREYVPPYTGGPAQIMTIGIAYPTYLAFDSLGNLFVNNHTDNGLGKLGADTLTAYAPPYSSNPFVNNTLAAGSTAGMAIDSSNNVAISNCFNGAAASCQNASVVILSPPAYSLAGEVAVANSVPNADYRGLSFDPAGDLFVTGGIGNTVVEYRPPFVAGQPASRTISTGLNVPVAAAFDGMADVFVANSGGAANAVTEYLPPYAGAPIAVSARGRLHQHVAPAGPVAVMLDAANDLFVLNGDGTLTVSAPPYGTPTAIAPQLAAASVFTIGP